MYRRGSYSFNRAGPSRSRQKVAVPHHIEVLYLTKGFIWVRLFSRIYSPVDSTAKVLGLNAMEHAVVAPLFPRGNFVMAMRSCAKTSERSYSGSTGELGSLWPFLSQQDWASTGLV
jgi:hypothetical protein